MFTITIETADKADDSADADGAAGIGNNTVRVGKLNLVDLAGSERQSKTGTSKYATDRALSMAAKGMQARLYCTGKIVLLKTQKI